MMEEKDLLQKIDVIRERLGVSYREASEALQNAGGDLLEALAMLEEKYEPIANKLGHVKEEAVDRVKGIISKGSQTKVRIKKDEKTLVEFPASWGVLGLAGTLLRSELAFVGVLATATALAKDWKLELVPTENVQEIRKLATEEL